MFVRCSFDSNMLRLVIWRAFSSKNSILNFSMFASGMGFKVLVVGCFGVGVGLATSTFGGMCRVTGE